MLVDSWTVLKLFISVLALLKPFCWKEPNLPRHLDCSVGLFPSSLTTVLSLSSQLVERSEVLPVLSVQAAQLPACPQQEQPQPGFPGLWAAVLSHHCTAWLSQGPGCTCSQVLWRVLSLGILSSLLMCNVLLIYWKIQRCTFISTQPCLSRETLSLSLAENF